MIHPAFVLRSSLMLFALLLSLVFLPGKAHSVLGNVSGVVKGPGGQPLSGAKVIFETEDEKGEKKVVAEGETDRKGVFVIPLQHKNLKSGNYTVTLEKSGFRTVTKTVKLEDGPNELGRIALELIGRYAVL